MELEVAKMHALWSCELSSWLLSGTANQRQLMLLSRMQTPLIDDLVIEVSAGRFALEKNNFRGLGRLVDRIFDINTEKSPATHRYEDHLYVIQPVDSPQGVQHQENWDNCQFLVVMEPAHLRKFDRLMSERVDGLDFYNRDTWWWLNKQAAERERILARTRKFVEDEGGWNEEIRERVLAEWKASRAAAT